MRFIDEVKISVRGGHGGAGLIGWRREKFIPMGGPDGGDGGSGGAVIFVAEPGLNTLIDFSFTPRIQASDGEAGGANCRSGASGEDLIREVPVGTQVFFQDRLVADLNVPHARWIAGRGGHGGKGNAHFKSSTLQAPDFSQPGQAGDECELRLVLKSVADVGLVGLPNAGKSTLISRVTKAHPKVADYPFTTLEPHLGVVMLPTGKRFVMADIPGIIEGAHTGRGLGLKFLKHIERTSVLVQFVDASQPRLDGRPSRDASEIDSDLDSEIDSDLDSATDNELLEELTDEGLELAISSEEPVAECSSAEFALNQFRAIEHELAQYSEALAGSPRVVVFSKIDLPHCREAYELTRETFTAMGRQVFGISSATGEGLDELLSALAALVLEQRLASTPGFVSRKA